jgi:hypothetical protein
MQTPWQGTALQAPQWAASLSKSTQPTPEQNFLLASAQEQTPPEQVPAQGAALQEPQFSGSFCRSLQQSPTSSPQQHAEKPVSH